MERQQFGTKIFHLGIVYVFTVETLYIFFLYHTVNVIHFVCITYKDCGFKEKSTLTAASVAISHSHTDTEEAKKSQNQKGQMPLEDKTQHLFLPFIFSFFPVRLDKGHRSSLFLFFFLPTPTKD